jgi:hypothetical protein
MWESQLYKRWRHLSLRCNLTNLEREEPFICPHGVKGFQLLIIFIKVFKKDLFGHYLGNEIYDSFQQE